MDQYANAPYYGQNLAYPAAEPFELSNTAYPAAVSFEQLYEPAPWTLDFDEMHPAAPAAESFVQQYAVAPEPAPEPAPAYPDPESTGMGMNGSYNFPADQRTIALAEYTTGNGRDGAIYHEQPQPPPTTGQKRKSPTVSSPPRPKQRKLANTLDSSPRIEKVPRIILSREEKKLRHNLAEQMRRDEAEQAFAQFCASVPGLVETQGTKPKKSNAVNAGFDWLQAYLQDNLTLHQALVDGGVTANADPLLSAQHAER